jgi:hypothetical protein
LLVGRQLGEGVRVADAADVGVLLPVLKRLANAGVLLGVVRELGPGRESASLPGKSLVAQTGALSDVEISGRACIYLLVSIRAHTARPALV